MRDPFRAFGVKGSRPLLRILKVIYILLCVSSYSSLMIAASLIYSPAVAASNSLIEPRANRHKTIYRQQESMPATLTDPILRVNIITPEINEKIPTMLAVSTQIGSTRGKPSSNANSIVLIGASYAEGWPISNIENRQIINKGISGQETAEMLARFQKDVVALKPDYVIIWGFINDIFRGDRGVIDEKLARTRDNIRNMVDIALDNDIVPVLATEVTIRRKQGLKESLMAFLYGTLLQRSSYQDYVNSKVEEVNHWLKEFADNEKLVLLDLKSQLADENGYRRKIFATPDGSHISTGGYKALTEYAQSVLPEMLK